MHLRRRNAHRSAYASSQVPFDVSVIFTPERRGEVDPDQWIGPVSRKGIMR